MKLHYRFSGPITNKVIHSQVAGMLAYMRSSGLDIDLLAWCGANHALGNRKAYYRAEAELKEQLGSHIRWRLTIDRLKALDSWLKIRELNRIAHSATNRNPLLLQTRSLDMGLHMAQLKRRKPASRFIFELRGDTRAELEFLHEDQPVLLKQRLDTLDAVLEQVLPAADLIICVSQVLKSRMCARHGIPGDRVLVQPCTADEKRFRILSDQRKKHRGMLGLPEDATVVVYSGSLVKGWDQPQAVKAFLKQELGGNPNLHALLLSPDANVAHQMIQELPASRVHHRSLSHLEIQDWLNAADCALLLRASHPLNEVASPTKAAEYLLCGLPLVISEGVGDYTDWIKEDELGIVHKDGPSSHTDWEFIRTLDQDLLRKRALKRVSRGLHAQAYLSRLSELCAQQ